MIAKSTWFNRRKYTGWGLTPKNLQGVIYVIGIAGVFILIQRLVIGEAARMVLSAVWMVFVLIDVLQVMASIRLDEREQKIEAIAERNAAWTMVAITVLIIIYVASLGKELRGVELVPVLVFPIIAGTIAKGLSHFILDRKDL